MGFLTDEDRDALFTRQRELGVARDTEILDGIVEAIVARHVRQALEAAAQRVEALPGPGFDGIARWHAKDQETYLLANEEAANAVRGDR